ncbi:MAG TPA: c-type cytochrome [Gemmatimonadaceae bacterium]
MRTFIGALVLFCSAAAGAQAPGKWPPDSLINTQVIPRTTSVTQVWGSMRNIAGSLGVSCTYCHVGAERAPLAEVDFISDEKLTKLVARQMMRMVQEINQRLDTLPARSAAPLAVTCATCHRGVSRPVPLSTMIAETAIASGADSAMRVYRSLRQRYFGRDSYDFGESSLNAAAFRTGRAGRVGDALALLNLNQSLFPEAVALHISRGNILLMRGDTVAAARSFTEALRRDPSNDEARDRLRSIGPPP